VQLRRSVVQVEPDVQPFDIDAAGLFGDSMERTQGPVYQQIAQQYRDECPQGDAAHDAVAIAAEDIEHVVDGASDDDGRGVAIVEMRLDRHAARRAPGRGFPFAHVRVPYRREVRDGGTAATGRLEGLKFTSGRPSLARICTTKALLPTTWPANRETCVSRRPPSPHRPRGCASARP
jgi:hypothetical protein